MFFCGYVILSFAGTDAMILMGFFFQPLLDVFTGWGISPETAISVFYTITIIVLFVIYFRYVFGYFMRNFERQADTYIYALFNSAGALISTLEKIAASSGQSPDKPNWHHFSIAAYLAALAIVSVIGNYWEQTTAGNRINEYLYEKMLLRELEKDPNQAGTLNNLAWLYATCEDTSRQNPERALALALRAAEIMPAQHILDTLAESYFVNGKFREALETGHKALSAAQENRDYFREQLEKFRKALEENDGMNRMSAQGPVFKGLAAPRTPQGLNRRDWGGTV